MREGFGRVTETRAMVVEKENRCCVTVFWLPSLEIWWIRDLRDLGWDLAGSRDGICSMMKKEKS